MPAARLIAELLQVCVLGLGLLQDGDVGIGVFPKGEETLMSGAGYGSLPEGSEATGVISLYTRP